MHSMAVSVLRFFLEPFPNYLSFNSFWWMSLKDAAKGTEKITRSSVNYLRKRKSEYAHDLLPN